MAGEDMSKVDLALKRVSGDGGGDYGGGDGGGDYGGGGGDNNYDHRPPRVVFSSISVFSSIFRIRISARFIGWRQ
jgi:hypothetical protein